MFLISRPIFNLSLLCALIIISISSGLSAASYSQDNTSFQITFPPISDALASDNSTLDAVSDVMDIQSKLIAENLEDKLKDGTSALELVTNNLTPMTIPPNETLLKSTLKSFHGIPPNADESKRKLAQDILSKYNIFEYIGYAMPSGDVYFTEPYTPAQDNVPTPNFAYREHFKGAIASKEPFLSNVIYSVSSGMPHVAIAVPVYSQNNSGSLIGVLVGGLNFTYFDQSIGSLNLTDHNHRIILADQNGTAIFDSLPDNNDTSTLGYFAKLQSFKNALEGRSGSMSESFDGADMLVSYQPVKSVQRTWVLMILNPI